MSKELITMETLKVATSTSFKDKRLAQATAQIAKLYTDMAKVVDTKNREFASILSKVKTEKSYEADGYKSVADYAEKVFGLSRSNAYALSAAGDIYNDAKAAPEVKALSPSKLAEVSNVPVEKLAADIKAGTISVDTTQKDLREYAKAATATEEKPKVLDRYTARLVSNATPDSLAAILETPRIMDEWDEVISQYIIDTCTPTRRPEAIKISKSQPHSDPLAEKKTVSRMLYITENAAFAFEFYTYTEPKKSAKPGKPKFTKEQLLAMLAEFDG